MRVLSEIRGFGPVRLEALKKKGICTSRDLLERLPIGYRDATQPLSPAQMTEGVEACFEGEIIGRPALHRARGLQWVSAAVGDEQGRIRCMWFNQPWMKEQLHETQHVVLCGRAVRRKNGLWVINPAMTEPGCIVPLYAPVPGVGQKLLRDAVRLLLDEYDLPDALPASLVSRLDLMDRRQALEMVHFPVDIQGLGRAKERLAFEELLLFQAAVAGHAGVRGEAQPLAAEESWIQDFYAHQPFAPTGAQRRVVQEIAQDLRQSRAMARMVQGDVGCGKTMIAFCALYLCARSGGQCALMAPTEILAAQHLTGAVEALAPLGITCGLLTGRMTAAERRRAREAIASGEWQVVIGTHALLSADVAFADLRLVITDEQHRFGVRHRTDLEAKGHTPHVMVMSATPIPRSLSLVLYGDLDISVVDERPPGRMPVHTRIVPESKREGLYAFIREQAEKGLQTYVVCPRVGEEDVQDPLIRSAAQVHAELTQALAPLEVGLVYGRMKKQDKEAAIELFYAGRTQVLVSTTVIEVGVNVPRATVMVIEGAERFGLAQLHQLRGRVGRGTQESWCFLMAEPCERLRILTAEDDGFAVARKDLELRGAGEFFGTRQSGQPQMPALMLSQDSRLLSRAREVFLQVMREPERTQERGQLLAAAAAQLERAGTVFARN